MSATVSLEEIYAPVAPRLARVPETILELLNTDNELASDVVRYFFSAQGKLLRPALTLLGAEIIGKPVDEKSLISLGSSFEIFHCATLIHDDIIDSAHIRRSLPTVHIKWNPQVAVLVGDYLQDRAIGAIFKHGGQDIVRIFLETAGLVCDGEIHELKVKDNFDLKEEEYFEIIDKKTAVLLACALEAGARFCGADERQAAALNLFGRLFGAAFQIVDDCLDFTGQEQEFGKTLGKDCAEGVLTLPMIHLIQNSSPAVKKEIFATFKSEAPVSERFQKLLAMVRESNSLSYALTKAQELCLKAREQLQFFEPSAGRTSLEKLADYVIDRNS